MLPLTRRGRLLWFVIAAVPVLLALVPGGYSMLQSVLTVRTYGSVGEDADATAEGQPTLEHYEAVFGESRLEGQAVGGTGDNVKAPPSNLARQARLLGNTLLLGGLVIIVAFMLGVPTAWVLARLDFPGRPALQALHLVPFLLPAYVVTWSWILMLGPGGVVDEALRTVGFSSAPGEPVMSAYSLLGCAWVLGVWVFPVVTVLMQGALARLDRDQLDAARLAGPRWRATIRIAWPTLAPAAASAALLVFVLVSMDIGVPSLLRVDTIAIELYARYQIHDDGRRFAEPAAQAMPLLVMTIVALMLLLRFERKRDRRLAVLGESWRAIPRRRGVGTAVFGIGFLVVVLGVTVAAPILVLVSEATGGKGLALGRFFEVAAATIDETRTELLNSVLTALAAAVLMTLVFAAVTYVLTRLSTSWRIAGVMLALAVLPLAIPPSLTGIGTARLSTQLTVALRESGGPLLAMWEAFRDWPVLLVLVVGARFAPFVVRITGPSFRAVDPTLEEASRLSGRGALGTFLRIPGRLAAPSAAGAGTLLFALAIGEVSASRFARPVGYGLVGLRLFNMIHYAVDEKVAALSVVAAAIAVVPYMAYTLLSPRQLDVIGIAEAWEGVLVRCRAKRDAGWDQRRCAGDWVPLGLCLEETQRRQDAKAERVVKRTPSRSLPTSYISNPSLRLRAFAPLRSFKTRTRPPSITRTRTLVPTSAHTTRRRQPPTSSPWPHHNDRASLHSGAMTRPALQPAAVRNAGGDAQRLVTPEMVEQAFPPAWADRNVGPTGSSQPSATCIPTTWRIRKGRRTSGMDRPGAPS